MGSHMSVALNFSDSEKSVEGALDVHKINVIVHFGGEDWADLAGKSLGGIIK